MNETKPPEEPTGPQEAKGPRHSSGSNTGFTNGDRYLAIGAFFVGIIGLLAALIALSFRSLILWIVLAAAFTVASVPLITALRKWKYITHVYAVLCAILVIALYHDIASHGTTPVKAKPADSVARSIIEIDSPSPNSPVGRCVSVSGKAKLPAGDAIWILVQGLHPTVYYPEGQASTSPSLDDPGWVDWTFDPAKIGSLGSSGEFNIYAAVVDSATNNFMAGLEGPVQGKNGSITYKGDIGTSADPNLPPVAVYRSRNVQRKPNDPGDCG